MPLLEEIADTFLNELRSGKSPLVRDYIERYPEYAGEIQELFPTLGILERGGELQSLSNLSTFGTSGEKPSIPTRIADYKILREIGRGGMGVVYEAQDERLGRRVALKILKIFHGEENQAIERFQREARMAAQLHHTNVVPVFDSGVYEQKFYYVMQCIDGISIDQLLTEMNRIRHSLGKESNRTPSVNIEVSSESGSFHEVTEYVDGVDESFDKAKTLEVGSPSIMPRSTFGQRPEETLPEYSAVKNGGTLVFERLKQNPYLQSFTSFYEFVAQVGIQVGQALDCAQRHGIVHRDIKPSNLLLDQGGTVWITDFGLAKPVAENNLTQAGQIIGTLRYMAPEGLEGQFTPQSDLYSLGLTLYELLTLAPAFGETNYSRLFGQVSLANIHPPRKIDSAIPRDLETIILKATSKERSLRYQRGVELADDLVRFLEERPIHARRVTIFEQIWRWTRRNKLTASLLASIGFLLFMLYIAVTAGFVHARILLKERQQESARAQANLDLALQAFENISSTFQERFENLPLSQEGGALDVPVCEPIIAEKEALLLETLLSFYSQYAEKNSGNRKLMLKTSQAFAKMGDIHRKLGRTKESFEAYEASIKYYRQALQTITEPDKRRLCELDMASVVNQYLQELHRLGPGSDFLEQFVNEMIDNIEDFPKDSSVRDRANRELCNLLYYRSLFLLTRSIDDLQKAMSPEIEETFLEIIFRSFRDKPEMIAQLQNDVERSQAILLLLLAKEPTSSELLISKTRNTGFLMVLALLSGQQEKAAMLYQEAIDLVMSLRKRFPDDPKFRQMEANVLMLQTYSMRMEPPYRWAEEIPVRQQALEIIGELRKDYPHLLQYQIGCFMGKYSLGVVYDRLGEDEKAEQMYLEGLTDYKEFRLAYPGFTDFQSFPPLYFRYIGLLIRQKKYHEAEELLQEITTSLQKEEASNDQSNSLSERWLASFNKLRATITD